MRFLMRTTEKGARRVRMKCWADGRGAWRSPTVRKHVPERTANASSLKFIATHVACSVELPWTRLDNRAALRYDRVRFRGEQIGNNRWRDGSSGGWRNWQTR